MTTTPKDDGSPDDDTLEERATQSRLRLFATLDALERRGTRLVATVHQVRNLAALAIDGVAVVGAIASLLALVRSAQRTGPAPAPARRSSKVLSRLAVFALFAGVAYAARRSAGVTRSRSAPRPAASRLRAV